MRRFVCLSTAVLIAAMTLVVSLARANAADEPYFITFNSSRDGTNALYRMNPDGSGAALVTDRLPHSLTGIWSPRDLTLVYLAQPDGAKGEVFRVRWDGSGDRQITHLADDGRYAGAVTWTPDGSSLLVEDHLTLSKATLRRISPGGADLGVVGQEDDGWGAMYSPDGQQIAFHSDRDGSYDVYVMRSDGTDEHLLAGNPQNEGFPLWSPDGQRILYVRTFSAEASTLYDIKPDGSDGHRLTFASIPFTYGASYSPDGRWIAFTSGYESAYDIYRIPATGSDGSDAIRLTDQPYSDYAPAWSPDGRWIAYVSNRDGNPEIYRMRADGSDRQRLTDDPGNDQLPTWSPSYARDWQPMSALLAGVGLVCLNGWSERRMRVRDRSGSAP